MPARIIVIGLFVAVLLQGALFAVLRLMEPQPVVKSHSIANATALRASLLQDRLDPLLQHTVEMVTLLQAKYGKFVDSPARMSLGVLVYVTTYFVVVERQYMTLSTGPRVEYPVKYRSPNELAAKLFYLPLHTIDRDYLRQNYWKLDR